MYGNSQAILDIKVHLEIVETEIVTCSGPCFGNSPTTTQYDKKKDLTHMKLSLHLIKHITSEYLSPVFLESLSANDRWYCRHSGPIYHLLL